MKNILLTIALYTIGVAVISFLVFTIIVNLPHKTFVISKIVVTSDNLTADSTIYWTSTTCKYTSRPYTVTRVITNTATGRFYTIDDSTVKPTQPQIAVGTCGTANLNATIPDNVPPGTYTLAIHIETTYNRWNKIPTVETSNQFQVIQ